MVQNWEKGTNKINKAKNVGSPRSLRENRHTAKEEGTLCSCKKEREISILPKSEANNPGAKLKAEESKVKLRVKSEALNEAKKEEKDELKVEEHACSFCGAQLEGHLDSVDSSTSMKSEPPSTSSPPAKRRRFVMESVELLPVSGHTLSRTSSATSSQVLEDATAFQAAASEITLSQSTTDTGFEDFMKKIKNPKVKSKTDAFSLTLDSIRERMPPIVYPTGLGRDITESFFRREFISSIWGGSPQATFPRPKSELVDKHGLDDWMCITLDYNPHGPQMPGAPGLYFQPGVEEDYPEIYRVLVRIVSGKWQYMGQYKLAPSKPLTKEEWACQTKKCHDTWAADIHTKEWTVEIRAAIYLQKRLHRPPSKTEVERDIQFRQADKNKSTAYRDLITLDDIRSAICSGQIPVYIYTMNCVGYDKKFAQDIHEVAEMGGGKKEKERKAQSGGSVKRDNRRRVKARLGHKRKRENHEDDEDNVEVVSEGEHEEIHEQAREHKSRVLVHDQSFCDSLYTT